MLKIKDKEKLQEKIGMYTSNEIYEELANGFLQRSMVDAMYFKIKDLQQRINDAMDYINFLVIFNENINGKFNETIWGEELLEILGGDVDD